MGKILFIKDVAGNKVYPVTIGDAVVVNGKTLTNALSDMGGNKVEANEAITGATKCKITYDSKGLVTAGADLAASDIPSLDAAKVTTGSFDAARIPSLDDSKITTGTLDADRIPSLDASKINAGTLGDEFIASAETWNAKQDALVFNTDYNAETNKVATMADVNSSLVSALVYKGSVNSNSDLPANHAVGEVYVVATAGTYAGQACEVGDYIICKTAGTSANNSDWDVINGENQVSASVASTAANAVKIATVDGVDIYAYQYSSKAGVSGGSDLSLMTTGEKYTITSGIASAQSDATQALSDASAAQTAADAAQSDATQALSDAADAADAASAAQTTANKGVSDAAAAQATANKGVSDAASAAAAAAAALSTANTAVSNAATAQSAAEDAQAAAEAAQTAAETAASGATTAIDNLGKTVVSSNSAGVALGGTVAAPTVTVTPGSVASGNTSVVTGGAVYTAISGLYEVLSVNNTEYSDSKIAAIVNVAAVDTTIK